ncbi:MAG TPA: thioredoxin domain-containing protein [Longimicrobium sp.]
MPRTPPGETPRGRGAPKPPRRSSLTPFYVILGLVLLAGIGFLAMQMRPKRGAAATQPVAVTLTPEQLQRVPGVSIGRADAPITIFEFADFQCPHCGEWAQFIEPLIKENLVATGKARYVFYDFPLGGAFVYGFLAARAGRCANEQGKFWEYHDILFANQQEWSYVQGPDAALEKFLGYAERIGGLNAGQFEQCLRSDKYQKEVSESRQLGESLGVQGTPSVYVNGQKLQQLPERYSQFEAEVRRIAPGAFAGTPAPAPAATGAAGGGVSGTSAAPAPAPTPP